MGRPQHDFLEAFKRAFGSRFASPSEWGGGQRSANKGEFAKKDLSVRVDGSAKKNEGFELGDLTANVFGWHLKVEFDSEYLDTRNLLKYWPYLTGHFADRPSKRIVLLHFSNWYSYGCYRDYWGWALKRMKADPDRLVRFEAKQFNHAGKSPGDWRPGIREAMDYLDKLWSK